MIRLIKKINKAKNASFKINIFLNKFRKNIKDFCIRNNSVLLIEFMSFHGESLPGLIKYLLDLDFNVDVVLGEHETNSPGKRNDSSIFSHFKGNEQVNAIIMPEWKINLLLRSSIAKNYKHIIINTFNDYIYNNQLFNVDLHSLKPVCVVHTSLLENEYFTTNKIISYVKMDCFGRKPTLNVYPHFFGEYEKRNKSNITTFFALNCSSIQRRNISLAFEACDELYKRGINNFRIKLIGRGIDVPLKYHNNFQISGFLKYEDLNSEVHESDFILALIDSASVQYTNKSSGTFKLSYGFLKPIVLHKKFSDILSFNEHNSVLHQKNTDLADAMEKCINMSNNDYINMANALEDSKNELYNMSLGNLKDVLKN